MSASWIWGYLALPTYGPPHGSIDGLAWPSFDINNSRPSRGAKPREVDDQDLQKEQPPQAGSRGVEISMQASPHEVRVT